MAVPQQLVDLPDCQENWEYIQSRIFDTGDIKTSIQVADHSGWVLCDGRPATGQLKSLINRIGNPWGVDLIPNIKERVVVGAGPTHALGASFGTAGANMQAHVHGPATGNQFMYTATAVGLAADAGPQPTWFPDNFYPTTASAGSGSVVDGNYPLSVTLNYFIHI